MTAIDTRTPPAPAPLGAPDRPPAPRLVEVLATGPLTTVQDLGRPGLGDLGVGVSGAADRPSLRLANRLVGNPDGSAALEVTHGGLAIRAHGVVTVAVTGAPVPVTTSRAGRARPAGYLRATVLADGDELRLGAPEVGLRTYVAVRGGIAVAPVLGSRSTDLLAQLGPPVVEAGAVLPIGPAGPAPVPAVDTVPGTAPPAGTMTVCAVPGPRHDWFTAGSVQQLFAGTWEVGAESNRVGMRLTGPRLERRPAREGAELPSEGVVRGSVQVPPSGQPIVFLADHPVTGGYPVIAVLVDRDTDLAAQARPGQRIRFWPTPRR
jgi:biotin-dependent carboxylase-like uncharacterized protein